MKTRFTENNRQKSLDEIGRILKGNTDKYLREKRSIFHRLIILIATVLGFTLGIATITDSINAVLKITWGIQITAILVGALILVLESEARHYRSFYGISAMLDILDDIKNKGGIFDKDSISLIMANAIKHISGNSRNKNSKERIFSWFTRNIKYIEMAFYCLFVLSFIFLFISFLT